MAVPVKLPRVVEPLFELPPPPDVGERGAVVALTLVSIFQILARDPTPLSAQFLYWACKERDGLRGDVGTNPLVAARVLQELGICTEATWPYRPAPKDNTNPGHGPPPPGAIEEARQRRITGFKQLPGKSVIQIKHALSQGKPVLLGLGIREHWQNSWQGRALGRLRAPLPGEQQRGGTSLCVIGFRDDETAPGGGYFIARNYWGADWAKHNPDGPGHCHIPYRLVADNGLAAIAFDGVIIDLGDQPIAPAADARGIAVVPLPEQSPSATARQPTSTPLVGPFVLLSGEAGPDNPELYPNGVSPDGEPLLRINVAAAAELALSRPAREPKERLFLYKEKRNTMTKGHL